MVDSVSLECIDHILVVTIDRPERRNAIDVATAEAIARGVDLLDADPHLRAGVLTGSGSWFSAGMDLAELVAGRGGSVPGRGFAGLAESPSDKPLVAAVEGGAYGGGLELLLCCDLVVAASNARLCLPEVRRGLIPAAGGLFRLPGRLPHHVAMEVILTGEPLTAARAERYGLVNQLCEPGKARDAAIELARRIAAAAPLAVRTAKQVVTEAYRWPRGEEFARQRPFVDRVRGSRDAREGSQAFLERRDPIWTGS
ncbi:crotonase/enoyl-CoA hydratase family protein [Phytoactinopolyspora limicola]|uniref:crotonase/enoyl-CoA hydratase family protein n=1 Tax=Phytoactinopolyspora limicola TaxID=2715536 RepID=UPI001409E893|nr:crotonase/enoyl-CoA hydratase family protein [Phytoactinopolyspora limicola]